MNATFKKTKKDKYVDKIVKYIKEKKNVEILKFKPLMPNHQPFLVNSIIY